MNCDLAEKISMLVDGELTAAEIESVREHLALCAECRKLEKDFLFFRRQLTTSAYEFSEAKQVKISSVPTGELKPFWHRWISLPVPVLALFIILPIALGAWLIFSERDSRTSKDTAKQTPVKNAVSETGKSSTDFSIARYDAGGRAEIYVAPGRIK